MRSGKPRAWGRDGYVLEGLADAGRGFAKLLVVVAVVAIVAFAARWAFTEYWITTHCTMVLGTRVCQ